MSEEKLYTHDEAAHIIERFESILSHNDIHVPSPEDDEREKDNMIGLYGSVYSDLLDAVENDIIRIINKIKKNTPVVTSVFSGNS